MLIYGGQHTHSPIVNTILLRVCWRKSKLFSGSSIRLKDIAPSCLWHHSRYSFSGLGAHFQRFGWLEFSSLSRFPFAVFLRDFFFLFYRQCLVRKMALFRTEKCLDAFYLIRIFFTSFGRKNCNTFFPFFSL